MFRACLHISGNKTDSSLFYYFLIIKANRPIYYDDFVFRKSIIIGPVADYQAFSGNGWEYKFRI